MTSLEIVHKSWEKIFNEWYIKRTINPVIMLIFEESKFQVSHQSQVLKLSEQYLITFT